MADNFERQLVKTKQFSPDDAGKRVGWAAALPIPERDDLVAFNVVTATVGPEGAYHGYNDDEINGERMRTYSSQTSRGFLHVASLGVLINRNLPGIHQTNRDFGYSQQDDGRFDDARYIRLGANLRNEFAPEDEDKIWADNNQDLLNLLKAQLADADAMTHYPPIYYLMNALFTHPGIFKDATYTSENLQSFILADASMAPTTRQEIEGAKHIISNLSSITAQDKGMLHNLGTFRDIPAEDIPDAFVASRRVVAVNEAAILEKLSELAYPQLVYQPRDGREWPYMDGTVKNEQKAFGRELEDLKMNQSGRAIHELERELKSIEKRIDYARQGFQALHAISFAERNV